MEKQWIEVSIIFTALACLWVVARWVSHSRHQSSGTRIPIIREESLKIHYYSTGRVGYSRDTLDHEIIRIRVAQEIATQLAERMLKDGMIKFDCRHSHELENIIEIEAKLRVVGPELGAKTKISIPLGFKM